MLRRLERVTSTWIPIAKICKQILIVFLESKSPSDFNGSLFVFDFKGKKGREILDLEESLGFSGFRNRKIFKENSRRRARMHFKAD